MDPWESVFGFNYYCSWTFDVILHGYVSCAIMVCSDICKIIQSSYFQSILSLQTAEFKPSTLSFNFSFCMPNIQDTNYYPTSLTVCGYIFYPMFFISHFIIGVRYLMEMVISLTWMVIYSCNFWGMFYNLSKLGKRCYNMWLCHIHFSSYGSMLHWRGSPLVTIR